MRCLPFVFSLAASVAFAQSTPRTTCDPQACTVAFDFGATPLNPVRTEAPYSGHRDLETVRISPDGTRATIANPGMMTWRDSKGRLRADQPAYRTTPRAGFRSPDDSVMMEIHATV